MKPAEYRRHLPAALILHRHGATLETISRRLGGSPDWWDALFAAASEFSADPIRAQILDMREAGHSIRRIAEIVGCDVAAVSAALKDGEPVVPAWDEAHLEAIVRDYESGLTVPQIRRKYGYRNERIAWRSIQMIARKRREQV